MGYELHLREDNTAYLKFIGDINADDVRAYFVEYNQLLENVKSEKQLHTIIDVSDVGRASSAARKEFGEVFRNIDPRTGKSAMIGANRYLRVLSGFVIKATGTRFLRLFSSEEEALAWFTEEENS